MQHLANIFLFSLKLKKKKKKSGKPKKLDAALLFAAFAEKIALTVDLFVFCFSLFARRSSLVACRIPESDGFDTCH